MKRLQLRAHLIIWPLLLVALIVIIYLALGERQATSLIELTPLTSTESR